MAPSRSTNSRSTMLLPVPGSPVTRPNPPSRTNVCSTRQQKLSIFAVVSSASTGSSGENGFHLSSAEPSAFHVRESDLLPYPAARQVVASVCVRSPGATR